MGLETSTTIVGLNALWPLGSDSKSQGDDHLRLIKSVLKAEFPTGGVAKTAQTRSRIVNGAMQVSQENGNTSGLGGSLAYYAVDQWICVAATTGAVSPQRIQSVTPNGSRDRVKITVTTADISLAAGEILTWRQNIEGIRIADFKWGMAAARQVVLRFGFKAPAGTYSFRLMNSAGNRTYIANFTVSAGQANTDTEQTFIVPGDTTGTWLTDTGIGITLDFCVATGSTYIGVAGWQGGNFLGTAANTNGLGTISAVYELFDVGLYLDASATGAAPAWQMPDEAEELRACCRYWQSISGAITHGYAGAGIGVYGNFTLPVKMRIAPATTFSAPSYSNASGLTINNSSVDDVRTTLVITALGVGYGIHTLFSNARM